MSSVDAAAFGCTRWMLPRGGTADRQGNIFKDYNTRNMFSESVAPFDDTQLVSARTPLYEAAATMTPPGQTKVETLYGGLDLVCLWAHEMAVLSH